MFYPTLHIALHFLIPGLIAIFFFKYRWKQAWLIMALTMVVDLDHLWAHPIYDPNRCSINFHNGEYDLPSIFAAHLNRGVILLHSRLKSLSDLSNLIRR